MDISTVQYKMCILQVNTEAVAGGAGKVALNLSKEYKQRGYKSWLAVDHNRGEDSEALLVPMLPDGDHRNRWARVWLKIADSLSTSAGRVRGVEKLRNWLRYLAEPWLLLDIGRGHEDFNFPGTWQLLELPPERPDILHCHNLHGGYFDLRALPWLSHQIPTILTLHDAWLLSGHCAHSFDCERWKMSCGNCPDLTIYPGIRRDATSYNWQRKRQIFERSQLYVATPSHWLMGMVKQSILAPAIKEARVIPNGVDLSIFHPANKQAVRTALNIPPHALILLFVAYGIRRNIWKDWETLRSVIALVAERLCEKDVFFIALGEDAPAEQIGRASIRFIPYQMDPRIIARYYQAADVYVHAAKAEAWGLTVTEALACGTPVVATAVGGVTEQVENGETGFLVASKDVKAMATHIIGLLTDETHHHQLGQNAAQIARERFDLNRQVDDYLEWYQRIVEHTDCHF
jgi:glycosyltransferase involved in cell wall biosynthesis